MTTQQQTESWCYLARYADCGCLIAVTVDLPELRREVARDVGQWLRRGLLLERVPVEVVRTMPFGCEHRTGKRRQTAQHAMELG